jgi:hypothetical protein
MRFNEATTKLEDLLHLRSMQDRLVTEHVVRKDWDAASAAAAVSARISQSIARHILANSEKLEDEVRDVPRHAG